MDDVEKGGKGKPVSVDEEGVIKVDTFKGFINTEDIVLGPENMPSSEDGRGLIRDNSGNLVFD